jgi:hypothetical protein
MNRYVLNNELNGIELYFDKKPEQKIIDALKSNKWRWSNYKKCWYTKQNEIAVEFAEKLINNKSESIQQAPAREEKQTIQGVKIGDIFTYSWGYEQTNVDCYQVVGIKGKSTVLLREIGSQFASSAGNSMAGNFTAVKDAFVNEEIIEKRVRVWKNYNNQVYIKFRHGHGHKWDGREFYVSWYG